MTEQDDELRRLLGRWEAPAPRAALDRRVREAFRRSRPSPVRRWLSIAAGVVLLGALAVHLMQRPSAVTTTISDAAGLRAVPEGAITVEKGNP